MEPVGDLQWAKFVWAEWNTPKATLVSWLAVLDRWRTKDMLLKWNVILENTCHLWGDELENKNHLYECPYSGNIWQNIGSEINLRMPVRKT